MFNIRSDLALEPGHCHGWCVEVCGEAVHLHTEFRHKAVTSANHKHLLRVTENAPVSVEYKQYIYFISK